jgi:hypothetical protein
MVEVPRRLWPEICEEATLYLPGRSLTFTRDTTLERGYGPSEILLGAGSAPRTTSNMRRIRALRMERKFPNGVRRDGWFVGSQGPARTRDRILMSFFESGFLDWQLTLPWEDEFDAELERDALRPPLNLHHACITRNRQFLYVMRGGGRQTWEQSVLGFHSWGYDLDRDDVCKPLTKELCRDSGYGVFHQSQLAVLREFNPPEEQILLPHQVQVRTISGLTLHLQPKDFAWHLMSVVWIDQDAAEILERRAKYPTPEQRGGGRIRSYHATDFTPDNMRTFFETYKDSIATTIEPALIMACVQEFGADFLKSLPYESQRHI